MVWKFGESTASSGVKITSYDFSLGYIFNSIQYPIEYLAVTNTIFIIFKASSEQQHRIFYCFQEPHKPANTHPKNKPPKTKKNLLIQFQRHTSPKLTFPPKKNICQPVTTNISKSKTETTNLRISTHPSLKKINKIKIVCSLQEKEKRFFWHHPSHVPAQFSSPRSD